MTLVLSAIMAALLGLQATVPQTRFATSADGTKIAYDQSGGGPVVILLHGGGMTRRSWHDAGYVTRLAKEFTVVTLDLRGNGESDKPQTAAAFDAGRFHQDIVAVADAVKAPRFALWGYSYGANVGRYLAASSDRVRGMVYIGIPFGAAAQGRFRETIVATAKRPAWQAAMLDYPAVEPADMRAPTLWLVGTANADTMISVNAYRNKLARTTVTLATVDGLTHKQKFERIDQVFAKEVEFTRALPR